MMLNSGAVKNKEAAPTKTMKGAMMPPIRALTLVQPRAVLRTTVGNSSAV